MDSSSDSDELEELLRGASRLGSKVAAPKTDMQRRYEEYSKSIVQDLESTVQKAQKRKQAELAAVRRARVRA